MNEEPLWPDDSMRDDVFLGTIDEVDIYVEGPPYDHTNAWFWFNYPVRGRVSFSGMHVKGNPFDYTEKWATPAVQKFLASYQQLIR